MARATNKLSASQIKNAPASLKPIKLADGEGMYLLVQPTEKGGHKWWRLDYRFAGQRKTISLGVYPETSLADAREKRAEARKLIAQNIDPSVQRKIEQAALTEDSLEAMARAWWSGKKGKWKPSHAERVMDRMEADLFPYLGKRPIAQIAPQELLACLRRIQSRGAIDTAHRMHQYAGQILRFAVAVGKAERDISADLKGALPSVSVKHHASITDPKTMGQLLRAIDGYQGNEITRLALNLTPLVFVRPGELRHAEWSEIDLEAAEWRIPAPKMKMKAPHIVPLSTQALAILEALRPFTGHGCYLFPSLRTRERPMSENTINAALRRLGYSKDEMTAHGFRSMASTRLNELGWHRDAIERQLAHAERDAVRAAYNYAEHLPERRRMMQAWADYLDGLRQGAKVTPIRQAR